MTTQNNTAKFNKSEIFKAAWKFVKSCSMTLSEALSLAWGDAKAKFSITADRVAAFADTLACCSAYVANVYKVVVTYRAKKGDKVFVDLSRKEVSFIGSVGSSARDIAANFNFALIY